MSSRHHPHLPPSSSPYPSLPMCTPEANVRHHSHMWFGLAALASPPNKGPTTARPPALLSRGQAQVRRMQGFGTCPSVSACRSGTAALSAFIGCDFVRACMSPPEAEYSESSESRLVVQRERERLKEWRGRVGGGHFNFGRATKKEERMKKKAERNRRRRRRLQAHFLVLFYRSGALMKTGSDLT